MRILFLIDNLDSGGAQRQLVGLAIGLQRQGHEVEVAHYYNHSFYAGDLDAAAVKHTFIPDAVGQLKRIFKVRKFIISRNPDAVIAFLPTPALVVGICKMLGGKWKFIGGERNTTQILSRTDHIRFRLYRRADAIVPNSFSQQDFIAKHYPELADKTHVITNFVDTDRFVPAKNANSADSIKIISVGRITEQKNVLRFIEAIAIARKDAPQIRADWYGRYENEAYMQQVNDALRRFEVSDIITFHAPDPEIQHRYAQSDIFILPSIYEGFPNVLCEAMSCALPALAGNVCDNPDILADGQGGYLFNPADPADIAAAIVRIAQTPSSKRAEMGTFNRTRALQLCSYSSFISAYSKLLNSV